MRWLARREYSAAEVRRKLQQKKIPPDDIDSLINEFIQANYISDERYADVFVRHRISGGYGPVRIRQELQFKGVASHIIEMALEENAVDWLELARNRYLRKYKQPSEDPKEYAKRARYLISRGFDGSAVNSAMSEADQLLKDLSEEALTLQ